MKRFGTKLYVIAEKSDPKSFIKVIGKCSYWVGNIPTLFTEYEKRKLFKNNYIKENFKVVQVF